MIRSSICSAQAVPSRQGVHWPQLSWAKNRQLLCRKSTIDYGFVQHDDGRRAQAQAADLARAGEIERAVELGRGQQAHADAAGNGRLGLAALPHAAAELVDQLAGR